MKVLVLSNGQLELKDIPNTLEALQEIVGGYIEIPYMGNELYENGIDIIINDEGKLIEGMNKEIAVVEKATGKVLDVIFGNCIFAGHDDEEGDTIGLTPDQMTTVGNVLSHSAMLNDRSVVRVLYV